MKFLCIFLISACCLSSCIQDNKESKLPIELLRSYIPQTEESYFPMDSLPFGKQKASFEDTFVKKLYSEQLYRLGEPSLFRYRGRIEFVRLTCFVSSGKSCLIRITRSSDSSILVIKRFQENSPSEEMKVSLDTIVYITDKEFDSIAKLIASGEFHSMSSIDDSSSKDGIVWIFETNIPGKYNALKRWSPDSIPPEEFSECVRTLSSLARKNVKALY